MAISAAMVKALREKTGLPMMECKQALEEAGGEEAKAIEILRTKGLGQMSKRAARETTEGRVACLVDSEVSRGGIVELRCETAPVSNTDDFINLAREIARHAARVEDPTPESVLEAKLIDDPSQTLQDLMNDSVNRIRENIRIARVGSFGGSVGHYMHHNGQVGVLIQLNKDCPDEVKADVCMHIAAMRPACARREEVNPDLVEIERKMAREQAQGKPESIIDKIVEGKLNRWFSEMVLLEQPFVKDDKKSVGEFLAAAVPDLTVTSFHRYEVGEVT